MLRILSSGLEGPERAAIEAAVATHHPWGGTCPLGRSGQFGPIPDKYFTGQEDSGLVEGKSSRPGAARAVNAAKADATLIIARAKAIVPDMCKSTIIMLRHQRGMYKIVDPSPMRRYEVKQVVRWIIESDIHTLNVASSPKEDDDDPFTVSSLMLMRDVLSFSFLCREHGIKIWSQPPSSPTEKTK